MNYLIAFLIGAAIILPLMCEILPYSKVGDE